MYLALYRKYRPQTFADVISQPHITTTLQNQIKTGQTAHAYLFTGSRGTGKTTCAKILAKALNCAHNDDGNPCLECDYCKMVDEGTPDILEIDAASNNGVDDVRALRDEVMYSPVSCKYRVYIIDEVHMLSMSAFNALLKTIEEPPPHVVFILATTESHKVPATILSRCQRFEFRRIDMRDSAKRLTEIAVKENVELDDSAALLISRLSDGGMRDALSLLDQCISVSTHVTTDVVRECAGIAGKEHLFSIADAVLQKNPSEALKILDDLHNKSKDLGRLIDELILHFRNLMLLKTVPDNVSMMTLLPDELSDYKNQCDSFTLEAIMRAMSILEECFEQLGRSRQRKILAEMCIIKLCSPRLDSDDKAVRSLSLRVSELEQRLSGAAMVTAPDVALAAQNAKNVSIAPKIEIPETVEAKSETAAPKKAEQPKAESILPAPVAEEYPPLPEEYPSEVPISAPISEPVSELVPEQIAEASEKVPVKPIEIQQTSAADAFDTEFVPTDDKRVTQWAEILEKLPPFFGGVMENTAAYYSGDVMMICGGAIIKGMLENADNTALLRAAIYETLGRSYVVRFYEEKQQEKIDKVQQFLDRAKGLGVTIKKK